MPERGRGVPSVDGQVDVVGVVAGRVAVAAAVVVPARGRGPDLAEPGSWQVSPDIR